jgi:hypothetical protein
LEKIMIDHNVALEDILDVLMLEEASPSYEALTRWSDRYPNYTDALAQFFAVWARQLAYEDEPAIEDDGSLTRRAVSYALDLMHRQDAQRKKPGSKGGLSLIKSAHAAGLSLEEVARARGSRYLNHPETRSVPDPGADSGPVPRAIVINPGCTRSTASDHGDGSANARGAGSP